MQVFYYKYDNKEYNFKKIIFLYQYNNKMKISCMGWIIREFFKIFKNYLLLPCNLLSPIVVSDDEVAFSLDFGESLLIEYIRN